MEEDILRRLGFTRGESKVYLTLLKLGNVTSGPIVDESGVSKSKVYEILERLTKKGIVSKISMEGIKHFQAADPERLYDLVKTKKEEIEKVEDDLDRYMPELKGHFGSMKERQDVNVFKGYKGLRYVLNDMLEINKEIIVFCATQPPEDFKHFISNWTKRRIEKKIPHKIIFNKEVKEEQIEESRGAPFTEVKTIFPEFDTPAVFNLYGNKTALILWTEKPIAIVIENADVTNSFRKYFEVLWALAKS